MNKIISFFMAVISFLSALSAGQTGREFTNRYNIPEHTVPYTRLDTNPKTDWRAQYIWDSSDASKENVWMCFRKTVDLSEKPDTLTACISADSKYLGKNCEDIKSLMSEIRQGYDSLWTVKGYKSDDVKNGRQGKRTCRSFRTCR